MALTRPQKGIFYKSIRHLFEGKRACIVFEMFEKSLQIYLPVHSSTNLCSSVTLSFITSNSSTRKPVHSSTNLCSFVTLSFITSNSFTCLTRPLVHLVHLSTYITTYIFLGIVFFVLYLCIVIRNEGMTNGVLMKQISKFAI